MAQAITFMVIKTTHNHAVQDEAGRWRQGDIMHAELTSKVAQDPHPGSNLLFVDVADVPNSVALKIRNVLNSDYTDEAAGDGLIRRRRWYLDRDLIPAGRLADLIANRRGSATWAEFKNIVKKRVDETNITDGDFA